MNSLGNHVLIVIGALSILLSVLILWILFEPPFHNRRWHRTGLWLFSVGYAVLGISILGEYIEITNIQWFYITADATLVLAPCVILINYVFENRRNKKCVTS